MRRAGPFLAAVFLALAGCGGGTLETASQTAALASWAASADMMAEAWLAGAAPRAYTMRALRGVGDAVSARRRQLDDQPAGVESDIAGVAGRLQSAVAELREAVAGGDRGRAGALRERVRAERRALTAARGTGP